MQIKKIQNDSQAYINARNDRRRFGLAKIKIKFRHVRRQIPNFHANPRKILSPVRKRRHRRHPVDRTSTKTRFGALFDSSDWKKQHFRARKTNSTVQTNDRHRTGRQSCVHVNTFFPHHLKNLHMHNRT